MLTFEETREEEFVLLEFPVPASSDYVWQCYFYFDSYIHIYAKFLDPNPPLSVFEVLRWEWGDYLGKPEDITRYASYIEALFCYPTRIRIIERGPKQEVVLEHCFEKEWRPFQPSSSVRTTNCGCLIAVLRKSFHHNSSGSEKAIIAEFYSPALVKKQEL